MHWEPIVDVSGPLKGVRVLEVTHWLSAPYIGTMLSDMGATVIKVEPTDGEQVRKNGAHLYHAYNHGKKSLAINLKTKKGVEVVKKLAETADLLLENFRPGKMENLNLGYKNIESSRLIYCSVNAFGETEEYRDLKGMDPIVQGMGAAMSLTGESEGPPMLVGIPIADITTAYMGLGAINAALYEREKSGQGQHLKISMIDVMAFNLSTRFGQYLTGQKIDRFGNAHSRIVPYQAFQTKDGWITVGAQTDVAFKTLAKVLKRSDLAEKYPTNDNRLANRKELTIELSEIFKTAPTKEWASILNNNDVLNGPVWTLKDLVESDLIQKHEIIQEVNHEELGTIKALVTPVNYSRTKINIQGAAESVGKNNNEILSNLGYESSEINDMREKQVIN